MLRYIQKTDKLWPLVALGFAYVLWSSLWALRDDVQGRIHRQYDETRVLNLIRSGYKNPARIESRWRALFPDRAQADDLLSLYRLFNLEETGLLFEPDKIRMRAIDPETPYIGITRICIANKGTEFVLKANDFYQLAVGLIRLSQRKELRLHPMRIQWLDNRPTATIEDLCILFRDPE